MRFSKQAIEALPGTTGPKPEFHWDDKLRGFGVKVNAGGSRQWIAQYRLASGSSKRTTLGRVDTLSLDEARKLAKALLAKAQTGADPQGEKAAQKARAAVTFKSIVDKYLLDVKRRLKPSTVYQVEHHLNKLSKSLHTKPLADIRRADIHDLCEEIRKSSGPAAANHARSYISAMYAWAIGAGIADTNPVVGTNKPAEAKSRERVLTDAELRAVWLACRDDAYSRIVRLLILTGQRRVEVGSMSDNELDHGSAIWVIPGERTKNGLTHEVPLSKAALSVLEAQPRIEDRALVFGQGEGGFSGWSKAKDRLDNRIASAGITMLPWTVHDLRRTAATMMADRLAVQPHVIEAVLNHVSGHRAGVAGIYNRANYRKEKRRALDRWAAYVLKLVGPDAS